MEFGIEKCKMLVRQDHVISSGINMSGGLILNTSLNESDSIKQGKKKNVKKKKYLMTIRKTLETYFPKPDKGNEHLCSIIVNERIAQLEKKEEF